jgi:hypothetical protein
VAKLLAYADCSIQLLSNSDPRLCDCNKIISSDAIPIGPDRPDKEKEITLKADWKYIGEVSFRFSNTSILVQQSPITADLIFVPQSFLQSVFHPPQV